jgi:hypothetical protein
MRYLSLIGFACRYNAHLAMAGGVDHNEQTLFDQPPQLIALFTIDSPGIGMHDSIGIKKARTA